MKTITEIRWHGRGGQGVKTACEFVAAVAVHAGKYGQGFPEYGPERSGAPMKGFTRICDEPIRQHCAIYQPDVVLVLDETLLQGVAVCEGMEDEGSVIINTRKPAASLRSGCRGHIWTVDATAIALDEIGRPIPNMPMIGALVKVTGILDLEAVIGDIRREFSRKFDEKTLEGNIRAVRRAFEEVVCDE